MQVIRYISEKLKLILPVLTFFILSQSLVAKTLSPFHKYTYELKGSADINYQKGSQKAANGDKQDKSNTIITTNLQFGYFMNKVVEPVIDLSWSSDAKSVGNYKRTNGLLNWGVGVIFNLPHFYRVHDENENQKSDESFDFWSRWLHYGGFVLSSKSKTSKEEGEAPSEIKDSRFQSYLIFGSRYMVYENIGFNVSFKLHLANQDTEVNETSASGGSTTALQIDLNLLSLSVFL